MARIAGTTKWWECSLLIAATILDSTATQAVLPKSCPFNVSVVTLRPHQADGFKWGQVIRPMDDPCVSQIIVDPTNDAVWYVGGWNGLYITRDGGRTWTNALKGRVDALALVPGRVFLLGKLQRLYAGIANKLYLSRDRGNSWTVIATFNDQIRSVLVAGNRLYVGLGGSTQGKASGVYVSNLDGSQPQFHPFGPAHTGLIVWTLARDPHDGTLYAGTEIFDHPQPYHPPFFRSVNGGTTWTNVAGTLPWHVVVAAVRPNDGFVYALTEGRGLYGSRDKGATWQPPASNPGLGDSLLMDPHNANYLFAGRQKIGIASGGIFFSRDAGKVFKPVGLSGVTVAGLALNGKSTRLYATAYGSGIYASPMPGEK